MIFESEKLEVEMNRRSVQDSMISDIADGITVFFPVNRNGASCDTVLEVEVFATQTLPKASPVRSSFDWYANDLIGVF
jgi:hypothetical protein